METVTRNVKDICSDDRRALENVIGQHLAENQRIVIQVVNLDGLVPAQNLNDESTTSGQNVPQWWKVYEGLDDTEVDRLDQAIRQRANLTRLVGLHMDLALLDTDMLSEAIKSHRAEG